MIVTKTFPAALLNAIVRALQSLQGAINRAESTAQGRLDKAADAAFRAEAQALVKKLELETLAVGTLREALRRAEDRLLDLKEETLDAVWDAHSKALVRQSFLAVSPEVPTWVYNLENELQPAEDPADL